VTTRAGRGDHGRTSRCSRQLAATPWPRARPTGQWRTWSSTSSRSTRSTRRLPSRRCPL